MTSASNHKSSEFTKLLFVGNSGAGKTGALCSLVKAGYKLRIVDFDNGLDALINHIKEECPDKLNTVQFNTYRDKIKMTRMGPKVVGTPRAYVDALEALEKWPDDDSDPAEWGPDTILVLDSLTHIGRATYQWAKAIDPTIKEKRQWYQTGQNLIMDLLANVTSEEFRTNVIVISHVEVREHNGIAKAFATSLGKALGPQLPSFFNTMLLSETKGSGKNIKRTIKTVPTAMMDLKNPAPMRVEAEYPMETGLASIFKEFRK